MQFFLTVSCGDELGFPLTTAVVGASLVPEVLERVGLLQSQVGGSTEVGTGVLTLLYVLAQEGCQL